MGVTLTFYCLISLTVTVISLYIKHSYFQISHFIDNEISRLIFEQAAFKNKVFLFMNTAALKADLAFLDGLSIILYALEKFLVNMLM